ncbi:hypothetical protein [Candidatus Nitrosopumilus sediminis]|uniref:hypothetical protein n=1 Tax=Candidatus Nitrosopumilus sediminis TaxID=1229909 RepID=UPI001E649ADF|nr:hypothetical protein [Candidatus Nitrosopumilus sediminis]
MVRYLYSLVDRSIIMQGVNHRIRQNMQILKREKTSTSVSRVECYVCGKGLQDGHSITAKTLPNGIVLFCDVHYSLQ